VNIDKMPNDIKKHLHLYSYESNDKNMLYK